MTTTTAFDRPITFIETESGDFLNTETGVIVQQVNGGWRAFRPADTTYIGLCVAQPDRGSAEWHAKRHIRWDARAEIAVAYVEALAEDAKRRRASENAAIVARLETTTAPAALYSRRIQIDQHFGELQPGDQIDNSIDLTPVWDTIARIGKHDEDPDNEDAPEDLYCEGDCDLVLFFEDDDCAFPMHVRDSDEIYARFPVEATER